MPLRLKFFPELICRLQVTDILWRHSKDAHPARLHRQFFPGKNFKKFQISLPFSPVIKLHSIGIYRKYRKVCFFLAHPLQCLIIRSDHGGHRRSDHCRKACLHLFCRIHKFGNQAVIPSQDGIHVPKSRTEHGTFALKPSWLIKAADISRTASGITDHDDPAQLIQNRHCS